MSQAEVGTYTWRDFIELDEDDLRELLDGHLVEIETPTWAHEAIVVDLMTDLGQWARIRNAGQVLGSGYKVRIDDENGYMPDVQFYRSENFPTDQEEGLERGHPDLVIEVSLPSSRSEDGVRKLHGYAAIGVPEYWLIDIEARTLRRLILHEGTYSVVEAIEGNATFRPESFDGLEIDLGLLWSAGQ